MMRVFVRTSLVLLCFILLAPIVGFAQIGDPGGGDPGVPISGIEWLLAAGGVLGARKILQRLRKH